MLSTSAQQLKDVGSSMGLERADLLNFIREQQKLEREEKDKKKTERKKSVRRRKKGEKKLKKEEGKSIHARRSRKKR